MLLVLTNLPCVSPSRQSTGGGCEHQNRKEYPDMFRHASLESLQIEQQLGAVRIGSKSAQWQQNGRLQTLTRCKKVLWPLIEKSRLPSILSGEAF